MDEQKEKEDLDKVEELRNRRRALRNGDRGIGQAGENTGGHGDRAIGTPGYRFQDNGRPGESDSGPADTTETGKSGTRESGNLVTDDPILPRIEEPDFAFNEGEVSLAKQQPPSKHKEDYYVSTNKGEKVYRLKADRREFVSEEDYGKLLSHTQAQRPVEEEGARQQSFGEKYFKREASKLSQKEVIELFEPLKQALQDDFGYLDEGIWLYCMSEDRQPIWGNIDDDEVSVLARLMLKQGQKNAEVAASVRILVDSDIYIQVAAIVAPRAIRTYQMLKGSPRPRLRQMQREARIAAGKGGRPI